ncbi:MAG: class I SAM-dependent methyltransferase [Flavobacteriales bacterium]|jgi:SAM-dependent methyltransferase|nr:class I SAM-dependent methyltransferase [Flavobacteriales bacterium]|tara:strand:+ start:2188 stop:2841 length:654 start_codon:yes stop_codon:yes gene_type:complete
MIGEFFIISNRIKKKIGSIFSGKQDMILDLGCGNNPGYHKFIEGRIICFDRVKTGITQIIGDANNIPFKANSFEKVISINSFYYFKNPFSVVRGIKRILKKNGKLVMVFPFIYPIHDAPEDRYRFTEYGIRQLLKDDFDIRYIQAVGGIFNLPAVFFHSLIKGIPLLAPKRLKALTSLLSIIILYPFYILAQIMSLLDFLDKSGRWPTYYFTVAIKK